MTASGRVLLVIKDDEQRKLYHEFLVSNGHVVYLCDDLANALVQLLLFPSINTLIVDTNFATNNLRHFLTTLDTRYSDSKLEIILVDSRDRGDIYKKKMQRHQLVYTREIDPQKLLIILNQLVNRT